MEPLTEEGVEPLTEEGVGPLTEEGGWKWVGNVGS